MSTVELHHDQTPCSSRHAGDLVIVTYTDAHNVQAPSEATQVMWGQVEAKDGFRVMAYDVPSTAAWDKGTIPYFVSVRSPLADAIAARWKKLSAGATVTQPLAPSGWAPLYGMLTDRYGITWVLDVSAEFNETVS